MFAKLWKRIAGIGKLVTAYEDLRAVVDLCMGDGAVRDAWGRFAMEASVATVLPRISEAWRTLESALQEMK